ncbi:MAG: tRNA uridine-5-carboxymethylaminomethyl(34) synthesis enzyme MnmG [Firmicutes bacterium]|nr:tRNA uridine-5-carboxymethylaminomethyl(34) synthesis enzyme MnmG [Bacillota bacterium]
MQYSKKYDVIVVGAGHAGAEAALAAARMGAQTLCLTINLDTISLMPCNPSVGGPAKGHLVREIDALGGEMGKLADQTHIHIRMLNTGKGPAVQALRAQSDRRDYQFGMKWIMENQTNLDIKQELVTGIIVENGAVAGVETSHGWEYMGRSVIITTGTFLKGLVYIGDVVYPAGRMGEFPSNDLSVSLAKHGLEIGRLKTGTVPRVDRRTIDYSVTTPQEPSEDPLTFSFESPRVVKPDQVPCYLTYTTKRTKEIILENLDRSPLYSETPKITGTGPRYCPSIETKIMRFSDKDQHQVFLEPEGKNTLEIYVQGLSTSLPVDVQRDYIRTVTGLEKAEIMRPGYAIEYDYVNPTQLYPWFETRKIANLFLAGQINGTSGYEEAAAQGLYAAVNAVLKLDGKEPFILTRDQAYLGVLADDLVTLGTEEPYRMLTSRCEYRLTLRQDNADERLTPIGYKLGLISQGRWEKFSTKMHNISEEIERLRQRRVKSKESPQLSEYFKTSIATGTTLFDLLKRPEVTYKHLAEFYPAEIPINDEEAEETEIKVKYEGYISRQEEQIQKFRRMEEIRIPDDIDYADVKNLSNEAREKLETIRPLSIGQATRISGVTPTDVSMILIYMNKSSVPV